MEKDTKDIFSLYGSDNVQYAEYDKGEAQEIVIPKEVAVPAEKKSKVLEPVIQKRDFLERFLDFAESLGGMYIEYTKKLIGILLPLVLLPYKAISKIFRTVSKALSSLKDKNLRQRLAKTKAIRQDIKTLRLLTLKQEDEKKTAFFIKELRKYFSEMLFKEEKLLQKAPKSRWMHDGDKVMIFSKGEVVLAFNFHPDRSFEGYFVPVGRPGEYRVLLSSDDPTFGGHGRTDNAHRYRTFTDAQGRCGFLCYLPNRTALVFKRENMKK